MATFTFTNDLIKLRLGNLILQRDSKDASKLSKSIVSVDHLDEDTQDKPNVKLLNERKFGLFYIEEGKGNVNFLRVFNPADHPTKIIPKEGFYDYFLRVFNPADDPTKTIPKEVFYAYYCPYFNGQPKDEGIGYVDVPYQPDENKAEAKFVFTATMSGCEFAAFYLNKEKFRMYHLQSPDSFGRRKMMNWVKTEMNRDETREKGDQNVGKLMTSLSWSEYMGKKDIYEMKDTPDFSTMVFLSYMNGSWWFISQLQLVKMTALEWVGSNAKELALKNKETGHVAVKKLGLNYPLSNLRLMQDIFTFMKEKADMTKLKKDLEALQRN